jgi:NACalpha-BTF3-like transcription factor
MVASTIVEKSCYLIESASCYDVVKDFSGPVLTVVAVLVSVLIAIKQVSKQHKNTLDDQKEEAKRNTRIELFKDINLLLDQSTTSRAPIILALYLLVFYSNLGVKWKI